MRVWEFRDAQSLGLSRNEFLLNAKRSFFVQIVHKMDKLVVSYYASAI